MGWVSNGDRQKLLEMAVHDNGIEEVGGSNSAWLHQFFQSLWLKALLILRTGILISYKLATAEKLFPARASNRDPIALSR